MEITKKLDEIFLDGILEASGAQFRLKMLEGFELAVTTEQYGYTCLFQSYIYWADGDYRNAYNIAKIARNENWNAPIAFQSLCMGDACRKLAEFEASSDGSEIIANSYKGIAKKHYNNVKKDDLFGNSPKTKAVVQYSLGRLSHVSFLIDFIGKTPSAQDICIATEKSKKFHLESLDISISKKWSYITPLNRLGYIYLQEYESKCNESGDLSPLRDAKRHFQTAHDILNKNNKFYALVSLGLALATFYLESGTPDIYKQIEHLLHEAIKHAPHDELPRNLLADFVETIRENKTEESPDELASLLLEQSVYAKNKAIRYYFLKERRPKKDFFLTLRRWSSFTPTIFTPNRSTFGGGYYLSWQNLRIVIDPGYGFVRNLSANNFNVVDIDAIVVTHGHRDHCSDLDSILSLVFEREKFSGKPKISTEFAGSPGLKDNKYLKSIKLLLPKNVKSKLPEQVKDPWEKKKKAFIELTSGKKISLGAGKDSAGNVVLIPQETRTHTDLDYECSRWLRFELFADKKSKKPKWQIGITGDTRYEEELAEFFLDCDLVIAHISTVDDLSPDELENDKKFIPPDAKKMKLIFPKFDALYKTHLGFWGTVKLVADLHKNNASKKRIILLGEFGEELAQERITVSKEINNLAKILAGKGSAVPNKDWNIEVLPSDIGTRVDLQNEDISILCQFGSELCMKKADLLQTVEKAVGLSMAEQPLTDYEIQYFCKDHQIIADKLSSYF